MLKTETVGNFRPERGTEDWPVVGTKRLNCRLEMGCRKLSYYEEEALEVTALFSQKGVGKNGDAPKKRVSYYPFGMQMPGRSYNSDSYAWGFQGQLKDDELKGSGNNINFKFRQYDTRTGRFFAVDPLAREFPWNSPYAFSENKVIRFIELEGAEVAEPSFYDESTGYVTAIDLAGRSDVNQAQSEDFNKSLYQPYSGSISQFEANLFDRWAESENLIASATYGAANDVYLTVQASPFGAVFIDKNQRRNIDGTFPSQGEVEQGFIGGMSNLVPQSKSTKLLDKLNAAQFSQKFKGNLAKLSAKARGQVNKAYNKVVDYVNSTTPKQSVKQTITATEATSGALMETPASDSNGNDDTNK